MGDWEAGTFNTKERGGVWTWQLRFGGYGEEKEIIDIRFLELTSSYSYHLASPPGMAYSSPVIPYFLHASPDVSAAENSLISDRCCSCSDCKSAR
jgi:hypothetical protein